MTDRERRNEIKEHELYVETELLVFGSFREDDGDEGFKATRWVSVADLEEAEDGDGLSEALEKLDDLVSGLWHMLLTDAEAAEDS